MKLCQKYKIESLLDIIDISILFILGVAFLAYAVWYKSFAELHIQLPFLNFPIFIGEIILFICIVLTIFKWLSVKKRLNKVYLFLAFYLLFILIKALVGFQKFGPLAFRHSAMFYYPLFAFITYEAYQAKFNNVNILLPLFLVLVLLGVGAYHNFTLLILMLLYIIKVKNKAFKIIGLVILSIFFPFKSLIFCCRTQLVGHFVAFTVLGLSLLSISTIKNKYKIGIVVLYLVFLMVGLVKLKDVGTIRSLLTPGTMFKTMQVFEQAINPKRISYREPGAPIMLYNPDKKEELPNLRIVTFLQKFRPKQQEKTVLLVQKTDEILTPPEEKAEIIKTEEKLERKRERAKSKENSPVPTVKTDGEIVNEVIGAIYREKPLAQPKQVKANKLYEGEGEVMNDHLKAICRLFIWRDMLKELIQKKVVLGFDFGKPLLPESIQISGMAGGEWSRDGWIAAHNSYLEIIYRAGILGLAFIFTVFFVLAQMIKSFLRLRSITGIFLISIIVYWLSVALFYVTFEMPYSAITFWSIFGLTLAYAHKNPFFNQKS